ncbi:hypothetical protein ASE17_18005 [Phenylobacterium sp. Root77]|jgi:hypothetical protein|uniref:hypothetical protein n=1 Tax=unclassified Phenylobacterium TaxID=2640670 RepID=UPI0006F952CE|nr:MULTISPECIES: hypothetical protein [unclassified Phenylobacterium]KQW70762.1 hypothetical protein ASC73_11875 [Phenylobacterium sp. Root1277]KQW90815.1 hypothetical protein ASC79_15715 [Phenylobacterium sp. Root1290]KRC39552.1 hypothetical protein ASE17_18005 [Phenylobacterium sp. Root77]
MFKVEFHFLGEGLWSRAAPMTQLAAAHLAKTMQELGFADEARVVPSRPLDGREEGRTFDVRV